MKRVISDGRRLSWFARNFGGKFCTEVEGRTYYVMEQSCPDYNGGYFDFISDGNVRFIALHSDKTYKVSCATNCYSGEMSAEAFSIAALLVALNQMVWKFYESDNETLCRDFTEKFYTLRDYAANHNEAAEIFAFID